MRKGVFAAAAAVSVIAVLPSPATARPQTTVNQTILDRDGDNRLEPGPGDEYLVRQELAPAVPGREKRRVDKVFFGQLTDTHVVDEESPLRVEFLDRFGGPFTSAYRPQEGLTPQVLDEMVRQMRNTTSPVTHRGIELVMTTGDNTDNTQCNETRWVIDTLDGRTTIDPDSGLPAGSGPVTACGPAPQAPDPTCDVQRGNSIYDGVRGGDEYYEPDSSPGAPQDEVDGRGYSPDQSENEREAQRKVAVRDFPGLFDKENQPFRVTGLGVPWYAVFGNHDALIQGNQPRNPALAALATGCVKVTELPATEAQSIASEPDRDTAVARASEALLAAATDDDLTKLVPPDPRRRPLRKAEWIAEHLKTSGSPVGHGFSADNVVTGMGNYAFSPKPGVRFVVLDTINEAGLEDGNVDDAQFNWLHDELLDAEQHKDLVMVFAHHTLETMGQPPVSPFPPGDTGGTLSPVVHFGNAPRGVPVTEPCHTFTPAEPTTPDETVRCLLLRHPSVVAFVNGHEHNNRVEAVRPDQQAPASQHGFWEVNTAAHIDWPQQSRVIDLVDNRDGTLSIFGTILDHEAAPNPGSAPASDSVQRLASISRELSFNDYQGRNGENDAPGDARGGEGDRNVELLVRSPYPSS